MYKPKYATTQELLDCVDVVYRLGLMRGNEHHELRYALREGLIVHPVWEDYGLHTSANGKPNGLKDFAICGV